MNQAKFLQAAPDDYERLSEISLASKRYWQYPESWIRLWANDLKITSAYITRHQVYKLQIKERIIGFCAIEKHSDYYEITHLWLDPAYIGKGFGKQLLQSAITSSVPPKSVITVEADPNAAGFYESQGFEVIGSVESLPKGRQLPVLRKYY